MDAGLVKLVVAGVLGAHGVGHVLGWMPAWGIARFEGVSSRSWLLSAAVGDGGTRLAAGLLFVVPTVGFVAAAAGLLTGQPWWRQAAVASAAVSLVGTALFPQAFTAGSTAGSVAVNLVVLYGILVAGWGADSAHDLSAGAYGTSTVPITTLRLSLAVMVAARVRPGHHIAYQPSRSAAVT